MISKSDQSILKYENNQYYGIPIRELIYQIW